MFPPGNSSEGNYYEAVYRLSMLSLSLLAVVAVGTGAFAQNESSAHDKGVTRMLLFGASWCAPCLVELRGLAGLATATAPDRISIAWTDGSVARLLPSRSANVDLLDQDTARQLLQKYAGAISGLPYAVMLDGEGRRCAEWRAPLRPGDVPAFRALCIQGKADRPSTR